MAQVPFVMGGGDYELLYFLVRHLRPKVVVETGVSAGWLSQAFATALERNGGAGHLCRSDFSCFRATNPEHYIGILVDPGLKHRWSLSIDGDEAAIPRIVRTVRSIGLFHYDSDKNLSDREFAVRQVLPLVMDDIADNA